ncbi:MAG TPA: hypothetical protein VKC11_01945 [Steroidobacteraceae bacterium]|nr:hypothetical protein [Steroidobacteraceae bacterium]
MSDTAADFSALVAERHARMSVSERFRAASAMFDVAVAIVDSSLPPHLSRRERRLARARRLYGDGVSVAALEAYADYAG